MDDLSFTPLDAMILKKRQLAREKKQLQARGYEDFIQTGDINLIRKTKQIASQITQLEKDIDLIQKSGGDTIRLHSIKSGDYKRMAEQSYAFIIKGGR
ncbi:MAG: hypothetical protein JL50_21515 [Peptococcaceae bacterium BICA1-7]|nr:MAG: hypothetical protein JL50_21515 [Peptococcaceae bacterium BICA1-7]HBV97092.1 hypothetical protein [Desulfotomaculum sp.]